MIAISATFTADPLVPALEFWLKELGYQDEVRLAPYNQVFQQLLDPGSLLAQNQTGANVLLVRLKDWQSFDDAAKFAGAVRAQPWAVPSIIAICPEIGAAAPALDFGSAVEIRPGDVPPVSEVHDPHAEELGYIPYTPDYFAALATAIARKLHALRTPPYKAIVVDCDDTLWSGICGEDGPLGVSLDAPRRALQEFLLAQHARGMLLAMCSKNNVDDVLDTFRAHPEMPLQLDHFIAWRINWEPKAMNLRELAAELELGLDSFILIDDSPKEVTEVQAAAPEVLALPFPAPLEQIWAFDRLHVTEEDLQRSEMYAQQVERGRAAKQAGSLAEFLESLQLEVRIVPVTPAELPRVAQLTQRTNQMNFSTVRRNESELKALLAHDGVECLTVHVHDRFGSYGLAGVMILRNAADALEIDTFLLSCRALGRGVEHRMLAMAGEIARERVLKQVDVPFAKTQRNVPALLFLESVGLGYQQSNATGRLFRFPAEAAAKIRFKPAQAAKPEYATEAPVAKTARRRVDYLKIAEQAANPAALAMRLRPSDTTRPPGLPYLAPRSDLERQLAAIWEGSLGVSPIGVTDNFFDLGGHSLLAVELLSRVRQALGVEVSLEVVYGADFTVEELARTVELDQTDSGEYAALLAELEDLSDDEVRELLARESGSCASS